MRNAFLFPCLAVLALSAAPLPAAEQKMEMPKPAAEMAQLAVFGGTWTCTGTTFANPMAPEHKTAAVFKGAMAVGGMWMHMTYDEKAVGNPMPIHAAMYAGWDAAQKHFVLGCVDNTGSYCTQTSKGWVGDTMVFEGTGTMGGQKTGVRDTFTRKGTTQISHTGEMQGEGGKWTKLDEESCAPAMK